VPRVFCDFDDYWSPLLGGQGTALTYIILSSTWFNSAYRKGVGSAKEETIKKVKEKDEQNLSSSTFSLSSSLFAHLYVYQTLDALQCFSLRLLGSDTTKRRH
jgi:hypothetical protein